MSVSPNTEPKPKSSGTLPRVRYDFLDGIRGLAALFVVFHHAWQAAFATCRYVPLPVWFRIVSLFQYGHEAVGVFIVLSGFCLMLPVARTPNSQLPKGFADFIRRRSRRILPPYFAALALGIAAVYAVPFLRSVKMGIYSMYDSQAMTGAIVSHLFLLHNLRPNWIFRIDPPLWSVATEWQIYFLFPLLLLPLWRKVGAAGPIAVGILAAFLPEKWGLSTACYWYIGLFGMGMAAASFAGRRLDEIIALGRTRLVLLTACVALAAIAAILIDYHKFGGRFLPISDMVVGIAASVIIVICAARSNSAKTPKLSSMAALSSPALKTLGAFSYSLYLVHYPLVWIEFHLISHFNLTVSNSFLVFVVVGLPITIALAYLFHLVFEKRFMNTPILAVEKQKASDVVAQMTEPAI